MSTESIKRIRASWGWGDSKCKYCGKQADCMFKGQYACNEHRNRLIAENWTVA